MNSKQQKLETVYIENLVPQDNLLRRIDKHISFSFIKNLTKDWYSTDNGLLDFNFIILFDILFISHLCKRQLVKDVKHCLSLFSWNVA
jgi:hypothetical protein